MESSRVVSEYQVMTIEFRHKVVSLEADTIFCLRRYSDITELARVIYAEAKNLSLPLPKVVGFVGNEFPLLGNLSVMENAILPVSYHGIMTKAEAVKRFDYLSEKLEVSGFRHARKNELTEKALLRARLLRALMPSPIWIFVDLGQSGISTEEFSSEFRRLLPREEVILLLSVVGRPREVEGFKEVSFYE